MQRNARALVLATLFATACVAAFAQETIWPDPDWQRATPEETGMDSRALAALVEYGANVKMDSLVVVRHGKVVTEAYYAPFQAGMKHRINSATKGVVAALAGIASGQGLLGSTDTPVLSLFADHAAVNIDARKKAMTLQTLLDMTSGVDWAELLTDAIPETMIAMERSADWQQFFLDRPMARQPGESFNYNSGNAHMVSAVIARKTGMSTEDYAVRQLFKPLAIGDFRWRRDPQGVSIGGFGLYLQTPDMAKIGYLYLHHGEWKGAQIVPREWVDKVFNASVPMVPMSTWRYGDFWWTIPASKAYMAVGFNRQIIMVLPEIDVVAAMTGRTHYPIEDVIKHLNGAVKSGQAMAPDPQGFAQLQAKVKEVAIEKVSAAMPAPALAREISGKTYVLSKNEWGWKELTLHLADTPSYDVVNYVARGSAATRKSSGALGMEGRFTISDVAGFGVLASKGAWTDDHTLIVTQRLPEEALTLTYQLRFEGNRVKITRTNDFGQRQTAEGETQP
jgi:CubicO group peptidase (beta-lactamase class C family)